MTSRQKAVWFTRVGGLLSAYAGIELVSRYLDWPVPPVSWFAATLLWSACWWMITDGRLQWQGRHFVHQMLRGVPVWARVVWVVIFPVLPAVLLLTEGFGSFSSPRFYSLCGLAFAVSSTLAAWARVRELSSEALVE